MSENIVCPKCGAGTQWSCHGDVGTAYCHEAGGTSRLYPGGWSPKCYWKGPVLRADDGVGVRLADLDDPADAKRIADDKARFLAEWGV